MGNIALEMIMKNLAKKDSGAVGKPNMLNKIADAVGGAAIKSASYMATGAGGLSKGLGKAGGALAETVGNIPGFISNMATTDVQRNMYGATPLDIVGGISSGLGKAAGAGIEGIGESLGTTLEAIGHNLRLNRMQKERLDALMEDADVLKRKGLSGGEWDFLSRVVSSTSSNGGYQ